MNVELMVEMRQHIERASDGTLEQDKIDELLDCALECARLLTLKSISRGWREQRADLEKLRGTPYIYVSIEADDTIQWIAIPPFFAEVEGEERGYALSPLIPSATLIASHVAQHTERAHLIANANEVAPIRVLIIHAYASPVSFEHTRAEFLSILEEVACGADPQQLGQFAGAVSAVTLYDVRTDTINSVER